MEQEELNKQARREAWYTAGREAGFTDVQLDFLKDYFAFYSDVPKEIGDLI